MAEPASWAMDTPSPGMTASMAAATATSTGVTDEVADRTSVITGRLKSIYRKTVLPVEKKYSYDYFYESPLLTDIEFDGKRPETYMNEEFEILLFRILSTQKVLFFNLYSQASSTSDRAIQCW